MGITDEQFESILKHEGRYANLASDSGGETYCGIARNYQPNWDGWQEIDQAKEDGADLDSDDVFLAVAARVRMFYDEYVDKLAIHLVTPGAFKALLDSGVTGGKGAVVWVQQSVCAREGIPCDVDGLDGPGTRAACADFMKSEINEYDELLGDKLPLRVFAEQVRRYLMVADGKARGASDEERAAYFGHLRSWLRRSLELLDEATAV